MPRPTIENIRGLPDFATVYNWNIAVSRAGPGIVVPPNFNFQAQTSSIPASTNTLIEVSVRGHKVRQPGITTYDNTMDIQCLETVDTAMMTWCKTWREKSWATGTGIADTRNNSSCDLQLQLNDRQDNIIRTFTLVGGQLPTYQLGDTSADSSDIMRPTLSVNYDYFKEV